MNCTCIISDNVGIIHGSSSSCGNSVSTVVTNQGVLDIQGGIRSHLNSIAAVVTKEGILHGQVRISAIQFHRITAIVFYSALVDIHFSSSKYLKSISAIEFYID